MKRSKVIKASGIVLSTERGWVYCDELGKAKKVQLGPQETAILAYLMEHGVGRPVGTEEVSAAVPSNPGAGNWSDSLLRMHVKAIRDKLRTITRRDVILTVQDKGYMLEVMR